MLWLYNIGIGFYGILVRIFALFNEKAAFFINGRKDIFKKISTVIDPEQRHLWFHFASLGEFEQGRPVMEQLKARHPEKPIVVTFFSPSGYEIRKNYPLAAGIFYLPLDSHSNAKKLIAAINPEIAVFTKYEYWYHYFKALNEQHIPLYIISGIFRPEQVFFKWYGGFNRRILKLVDHFFVQNTESVALLESMGIDKVSLSGDTRFDRVAENASAPKEISVAAQFTQGKPVFIAGSTWPADEKLIAVLIKAHPDWKFIIAPHEINEAHIQEIEVLLPGAIRYSDAMHQLDAQVLIINNIGLLSSLYQYGKMSYIGGGFGVSIHNTLEAAAFGIPVIFGPVYHKFQEAKDMIELGAAISIDNAEELQMAFEHFRRHEDAGNLAKTYVSGKVGSTAQIVSYMEKKF
ncbi:3-deoxy-D-manno-octulosonic-acid transferase [Pedobacter sp. BAL39]|uniref:3-deoxy-D-manno-octulosonic acid transferase n=1 Tax=Pedobacter sp. BAL39 TaxID=391596 RepID=UPI000155922F|nr:glycosyltransferase N-terminal domain-containing protein [Pedobacter sp. BAL39]EDM35609.1 3-deoxy-D-manno-octulosonic-acid transferase [Pedobacter sp. BAL39]